MGAGALSKHTTATAFGGGEGEESEGVSMWNLRHVIVSTHMDNGVNAAHQSPAASATRVARIRRPRTLLRMAILLIALLTVLPIACSLYTITAPSVSLLRQGSAMDSQQYPQGASDCDNDGGTPIGPSHGVDTGLPTPAAPPCEELCERIQATYHDPRTQVLLLALAQTPTGRGAVAYLLTMADQLGEGFITWRDLGKVGNAGENNAGGYIQMNSAMLTRIDIDLGHYFLVGTLLHETVESYYDIGEGIRDMGTRHADYVAQWFNGKFERELHALPYYNAQDPFWLPSDDNAYGLRYDEWLQTEDGRLYLGNPANSDLRTIDRKGHAWAPSDWLAERGGFWLLGQGTDVTPVPNPVGLTTAMLAADDLQALAG